MGAMKRKAQRRADGKAIPKGLAQVCDVFESIKRDDKGNMVLDDRFKVVTIPDGVMSMDELDADGNVKPRPKEKPEPKRPRHVQKKRRPGGAAVTMADVEAALGRGYSMEPDRTYKCRRWIVARGKKEWRVRYNGKLGDAVREIKKNGAQAWLKKYTMRGR